MAQTNPDAGNRLFLGNAVNVFKGPKAFMMDASLGKTFAVTESKSANVWLEAFNVFNRVVLNGPSATVSTDMTTFGLISSAWDPRKIQISARFIF